MEHQKMYWMKQTVLNSWQENGILSMINQMHIVI